MDNEDGEYGLSAGAYMSASISVVSGNDYQNQVFPNSFPFVCPFLRIFTNLLLLSFGRMMHLSD
ncbi:hypothetical protein LguiA_011445 [Lonicera macranthoides]